MANIIVQCKCGKELDRLSTNLIHKPHTDITITVDPCEDCLNKNNARSKLEDDIIKRRTQPNAP